jgi:nitrate reductase delta subunit
LLGDPIIDNLGEFADHFTKEDIIDWQAYYVSLFDTSRKTSLYIFEHLKGDSKDRGSAMTDLMDFYRDNDLVLSERELRTFLFFLNSFRSLIRKKLLNCLHSR